MGFFESVHRCVFEQYADFQGRASRSDYWWLTLLCTVLNFPIEFTGVELGDFGMAIVLTAGIAGLLLMVPYLAVCIRRLHDTDRSAWCLVSLSIPAVVIVPPILIFADRIASAGLWEVAVVLMGLVVVVPNVIVMAFLLQRGTDGDNRFGPDPLGNVAGRFA